MWLEGSAFRESMLGIVWAVRIASSFVLKEVILREKDLSLTQYCFLQPFHEDKQIFFMKKKKKINKVLKRVVV